MGSFFGALTGWGKIAVIVAALGLFFMAACTVLVLLMLFAGAR